MFTTQIQTPPAPSGRRAGATWVAATGAFLVLAAAAVFVAVSWDRLPEAAKLGVVGALTGGFLAGGRALRRTLPATGDVLFHLGALLLPVDVAGLNLRLGLGWRALLLGEGLVGTVALGALAATAGSVVLGWAAAASVVVLAAGVAAVSAAPAPLALAAAAVGAHLLGHRRLAVSWAAVAGLAPVAGAAATALVEAGGAGTGAGVLVELGLAGRAAALAALASGGMAALVLGREAARRHDLALVALAGTCLVSGAATTWVAAEPPSELNWLALPALFLIVQTVTMACDRDPFWRRPSRALAIGVEAVAAVVATPVAVVFLLLAPVVEEGIDFFTDAPGWRPDPVAGVAWGLLAAGWLLAAWRRHGPQPSPLAALRAAVADNRTVAFVAAAAGAGVVVGTASYEIVSVALLALAAGLVAARGLLATVVAAGAAMWAPVVVVDGHPLAPLAAGLAGAAVVAAAARRGGQVAGGAVPAAALAVGASLVALGSCALVRETLGGTAAMTIAVFAAWGVALAVEGRSSLAAHAARSTMLLGVAGAAGLAPADLLPVALAATLLFAVDALRHAEPAVALGAAGGLQVALGAAAGAAGLDVATTGVVLCLGGVVAGGLAALVPIEWRLPFGAAAAGGLIAGLTLASADPARFAEALLLSGGMAVAAGILTGNGVVAHAGGMVATTGLAMHLSLEGVTASEAFAVPVSLQLLVAGVQLRRRPPVEGPGGGVDVISSWVAYGPAIGLLGGASLAERVAGGPAWHAVLAGAVGVAAVAAGGWLRLAGPLLIGTGLVAAVTVFESLSALAGVPTWAWLAAGGFTLLGVGVALERADASPVEAGRRLVDVVSERFD